MADTAAMVAMAAMVDMAATEASVTAGRWLRGSASLWVWLHAVLEPLLHLVRRPSRAVLRALRLFAADQHPERATGGVGDRKRRPRSSARPATRSSRGTSSSPCSRRTPPWRRRPTTRRCTSSAGSACSPWGATTRPPQPCTPSCRWDRAGTGRRLIGLYPNVNVYTAQLRALEAYCKANPQSATSRFVLAYHYLTEGISETPRQSSSRWSR